MKATKKGYMDWSLQLKLLSLSSTNASLDSKSKFQVSRSSFVPRQLIGAQVNVHNGLRLVALTITEQMVGHRFGEFVTTTAWATQAKVAAKPTKGSKGK